MASPVRFGRQHSAVAQEGQRQMDNAGRYIGFRRTVEQVESFERRRRWLALARIAMGPPLAVIIH
ncbi:MAG: hypothetical protein JO151_19350 [Verrucomicrobia bacterium]|nr:hypothetical protein [Verrucomicrobiota bacterium]